MGTLETVHAMLKYGDTANNEILAAADSLDDALLDRSCDMGRGNLRRTLLHILAGETTWLARWQGKRDTAWPNEEESAPVAAIRERLLAVRRERDAFFATLDDAAAAKPVIYRDSKGSLFQASLRDMMLQMCVHSIHHRAQAANMLRRLGATDAADMDYMYHVRKPASE